MQNCKTKIIIFLLFLFCLPQFASPLQLKYVSNLEKKLLAEWQTHQTISDTIAGWLIADGTTDSTDIKTFKVQLERIITKLSPKVKKKSKPKDKAKEIFKFLHKSVFKSGEPTADLADVFKNGSVNALSANAIYYYLCKRLNVPAMLSSDTYELKVEVMDKNQPIKVDILDPKKGFNKRVSKRSFIDLLVESEIISKDERKASNDNALYNKYMKDYKPLNSVQIMGMFYNENGVIAYQNNQKEKALDYLEKAFLLDGKNTLIYDSYKAVLYQTSDASTKYETFIPYLKNALWLFGEDDGFADGAKLMAKQAVYRIGYENGNYDKALELILEFKTLYLNESFIIFMNKLSADIEFDKIIRLVKRGEYQKSYPLIINLYQENPTLENIKDLYVDVSLAYAQKLIRQANNITRATSILDSLHQQMPDHHTVKEKYALTLLMPLFESPEYVERNPNTALKTAWKAYKIYPKHETVKRTLVQVYHTLTMFQVRQGNVKKAHNWLIKGLKHFPENPQLNEDLAMIESAFDSIRLKPSKLK